MKTLPTRTGSASFEYVEGLLLPERKGDILRLPYRAGMRMEPLLHGQQFLLRYDDNEGYFLGMDEQPFLTRLTRVPLAAFDEKGESGFFESIFPLAIAEVREHFPTWNIRRQGDIHALEIDVSWQEMECNWRGRGKGTVRRNRARIGNVLETHVFGTNHHLTGAFFGPHMLRRVLFIRGKHFRLYGTFGFGEGTITAPDHAPQAWTGRPHLIARTRNMATPTGIEVDRGWE